MQQPGQATVGIVLAGGNSTRLASVAATGGGKALLTLQGQTFLENVVTVVAAEVGLTIVVAASGQRLPALDGVRIVHDLTPGAGPLAGIRDGLRAVLAVDEAGDARDARDAAAQLPHFAFVASCDVPLLHPLVVRHLIQIAAHTAVASSGIAWALPWVDAHRQVLVSAASLALLPQMEAYLASGRRDPQGLVAQLLAIDPSPIRLVTASELTTFDPALASFFDIDTADDFERLQTLPGYPPSRN